jgi:lactate permease
VVFAVFQFITSNYISIPLTDIVASLASALAVVLFLRVWHPAETYIENDTDDLVATGAGGGRESVAAAGSSSRMTPGNGGVVRADRPGTGPGSGGRPVGGEPAAADPPAEVARAYAPYLIIIAVFVVAQLPGIKDWLDKTTRTFQWPGLDVVNTKGKPLASITFKFNWLTTPGTMLLIAGLLTMLVLTVSASGAVRAYRRTLVQLWSAIVTVMAVLALAYVMNASGQTGTLGTWMAGAGSAFAFLSPILGWLGVAVTGSDTSSNSLFGALQVTAAKGAGLDPTLMAGSNSSGGVLGKMISPQNLAIAASAVGMGGREGDIFRKVVGWSLVFLLGMCVLAYLQSTAVLSWMVP